jgi:hypothetical protein
MRGPGALVLLAGAGLAMLALAAVPLVRPRQAAADPASRANLAYRKLQEQIQGGAAAVSVADSAAAVGDRPRAALQRDLFSPAWRPVATGAPGAAPAAPSGPPALSGIFIDGATREAILGGERVREGDRVQGYRVLEIAPGGVRLQTGKTTVQLRWGDQP